jgi:hypothetical protein
VTAFCMFGIFRRNKTANAASKTIARTVLRHVVIAWGYDIDD